MDTGKRSGLLRIAPEILAKRTAMAEGGAQSGFTLVELMVVLLIMAILLAIAIPTFLGVTGSARDRAAQSDLTNGLTSSKAIYASQGSYPVVANVVATLATQEPDLKFSAGAVASMSGNPVSVNVSADGQQLVLVAYSPNSQGTCWALSDNEGTLAADDLGAASMGRVTWNGRSPLGRATPPCSQLA
jgi:type IV pilus assembly protein PilA